MTKYRDVKNHKHEHRGKSSEKLIDKNIVLKGLNILLGQTILDAGCGNGYMAKEFAKIVQDTGKVYALDPYKVSIEMLQAETKDTIIEPFIGDITKPTKLEKSSIDLIYLSTVVHGFSEDDIKGLVKEVKRLLKPKGRLAIVEINKEETPFGPPLDIRFSPEELKQTIGLTPKSLFEVGQHFYMQLFEK